MHLPVVTPVAEARPIPAPLVVDFTAYAPASLQETISGFTKPMADGRVKADDVGAVVVLPEPVNGAGLLTWNISRTPGWTDDRRFITDLLDQVEATLCIDTARVLGMGFAIGGVMASVVTCQSPQRFTMLATVSGLWDPPGCGSTTASSVPVVSFHGNDDHFLPFDGGIGDHVDRLGLTAPTIEGLVAMATRPGARPSSDSWAQRNGCGPAPQETAVSARVRRLDWEGCSKPVRLFVIEGGTHTWPGNSGMGALEPLLGAVFPDLDANAEIWSAFAAFTATGGLGNGA